MENRMKEIMGDKRISQAELVRRSKISPSSINILFHKKMIPFPGWKKRIAQALDCKIDEVFPRESEE